MRKEEDYVYKVTNHCVVALNNTETRKEKSPREVKSGRDNSKRRVENGHRSGSNFLFLLGEAVATESNGSLG